MRPTNLGRGNASTSVTGSGGGGSPSSGPSSSTTRSRFSSTIRPRADAAAEPADLQGVADRRPQHLADVPEALAAHRRPGRSVQVAFLQQKQVHVASRLTAQTGALAADAECTPAFPGRNRPVRRALGAARVPCSPHAAKRVPETTGRGGRHRMGSREVPDRGRTHHDVRPRGRRPEPHLSRRRRGGGHGAGQGHRAAHLLPVLGAVRPGLLPAAEDRRTVVRLRQEPHRRPAQGDWRRRGARGSTPSSASSTSGT